jgi:hypothetical protein
MVAKGKSGAPSYGKEMWLDNLLNYEVSAAVVWANP